MDFTNYRKEVQKLAEEMMELRQERGEAYMESCRKMVEIGKEEEDAYLLGFAYYCMAEYYLCQNDHQSLVICLAEGIVNQQRSSQWNLLVRSHNVMGIDAFNRGNTAVALDQYITAISYGEKYGFCYETAKVNYNIGRLYMGFGEYGAAVRYLRKAQDIFLEHTGKESGKGSLANAYASLGRCSLFQGNLKEAIEYEGKITAMGKQAEAGSDFFLSQGLFARIRQEQGQEKARDGYIKNIRKKLEGQQSFLECHEEIFDFLDFLLEIGKYEELQKLFPRLGDMAKATGITHLKMELLRRQAEYFRAVQNRGDYLEICAKIYEGGRLLKEENIGAIHQSIELRFSLEKARKKERKLIKEKEILQERSEKDALTGLPNRYKLNDYAAKIFDKARERHKLLAIEIFDVDYFKQYNDAYGHQAGDICLMEIGKVLDEFMQRDENIFCARYGGDEFIIIYYGKTDEEALDLAKELRGRMLGLKLEHKDSQVSDYVTVSQGICNSIPKYQNRMWDYLYAADKALYRVKKKRKNSICLIHGDEEESVVL
ncbi:MAG: GGDEF domain-containing protein [Lachnospiraceae bacterium]|jgi:diguanylate cyclase (GGDEF)-like protein|nr:GGDEF domain-containing protein [Lachnospiraceae bacterium]